MAAHARLLQSLRLISRAPDLRDVARCIEANAAAACLRGYASVRAQQVACHRCSHATAVAPPPLQLLSSTTVGPPHHCCPAWTVRPVYNAGSCRRRSSIRRSGPGAPAGAPSLLAAALAFPESGMR